MHLPSGNSPDSKADLAQICKSGSTLFKIVFPPYCSVVFVENVGRHTEMTKNENSSPDSKAVFLGYLLLGI